MTTAIPASAAAISACLFVAMLCASTDAHAVTEVQLLRLHQDGASDAELIARIEHDESVFELTSEAVQRLRAAGLPRSVVEHMLRTPFRPKVLIGLNDPAPPLHRLVLRDGTRMTGILVYEGNRRLVFQPMQGPVRHLTIAAVESITPLDAPRRPTANNEAGRLRAKPKRPFTEAHRLSIMLATGYAGSVANDFSAEGVTVLETTADMGVTVGVGFEMDFHLVPILTLGPIFFVRSWELDSTAATGRDVFVELGGVLKLGLPLGQDRAFLYLRVPGGLSLAVPAANEGDTIAGWMIGAGIGAAVRIAGPVGLTMQLGWVHREHKQDDTIRLSSADVDVRTTATSDELAVEFGVVIGFR